MLTQKLTTNGQNDAPDRSTVAVYHRPRTRPTSTERTSTDQSLDSTDVPYLIRNPDSSETQPTPQLSITINPSTHLSVYPHVRHPSIRLSGLGLPRCPIYTPLQPDVNMAGRADGSRTPKVRAPISRDEAIYRNRDTPRDAKLAALVTSIITTAVWHSLCEPNYGILSVSLV
jgi:hypothetical protein